MFFSGTASMDLPRTPNPHRQRWFSTLGAVMASVTLATGLSGSAARADNAPTTAGAKGAQVYCFMRAAGHDHEVSWNAAYSLIKRQSGGLFKTSPEHAAVMITETVVQNPSGYPECGRFLGDLFSRSSAASQGSASETATPTGSPPASRPIQSRTDRYAN